MSLVEIQQSIKDDFIELCKEAAVHEPFRPAFTHDGQEVPIFNLDKLWETPIRIEKYTDIVSRTLNEFPKSIIDGASYLVSISSWLGSIGVGPLLGSLSISISVNGIIAREKGFGEFVIYPRERSRNFKRKNIIVVTDGIIQGSSLSHVNELIQHHNGKLTGILILADIDNHTLEVQKIIEEIPTITILKGPELNLAT